MKTAHARAKDAILEKLRSICLPLPDTTEREAWGHPNFYVKGKTFAVYEQYKGEWCIAFKVDPSHRDLFLKDSRFYITPYVGKHGWISLRIQGRLNWQEIRHLVKESYNLVSPKRSRNLSGKFKA